LADKIPVVLGTPEGELSRIVPPPDACPSGVEQNTAGSTAHRLAAPALLDPILPIGRFCLLCGPLESKDEFHKIFIFNHLYPWPGLFKFGFECAHKGLNFNPQGTRITLTILTVFALEVPPCSQSGERCLRKQYPNCCSGENRFQLGLVSAWGDLGRLLEGSNSTCRSRA
jgi:hypothetical protein